MPQEIERKFLIHPDKQAEFLASLPAGLPYRQGYLGLSEKAVVRVRSEGMQGKLTIKGKAKDASGLLRPEYEYDIPVAHVQELFALCLGNIVEKTRHKLEHQGHLWEIDVFTGANAGLVVAEIELARVDEIFVRPDWLGQEVTLDARYKNARLAHMPLKQWAE